MDLSLMFAIFRRLSGYPLDARGNAQRGTDGAVLNVDGSQGVVIPVRADSLGRSDLSTDNPDASRLFTRGMNLTVVKKVPVYHRGTNDRKWADVWPAISFFKVDETAGQMQWTYQEDVEVAQVGTANIVDPTTGETVSTTYDTFTTRRRPGTWDSWYAVSLWSKDPLEMALMEHALKHLWDRQGSLRLERADGTWFPANYTFERYAVLDQGEQAGPARGPGPLEESYLRRDYTYRFEIQTDNTVNGFGISDIVAHETILSRVLEAERFMYRAWLDDPDRETVGVDVTELEAMRDE